MGPRPLLKSCPDPQVQWFRSVNRGIFQIYHARLLQLIPVFMAQVGIFIKVSNILFILTVFRMMRFNTVLLEPGCLPLSTRRATSWWVNLAMVPFGMRLGSCTQRVLATLVTFVCSEPGKFLILNNRNGEEKQNRSPQKMPLWCKDYFEQQETWENL